MNQPKSFLGMFNLLGPTALSILSISGVITLEHAGTPKEHIPPLSSVSAPTNCTCGPDMLPGIGHQIDDVETHQNVCLWCVFGVLIHKRSLSFIYVIYVYTNYIIINSVKLLTNIKNMYHDIFSYIYIYI